MDAQRFGSTVAHDVVAHLAARGLNGVINLTRRYGTAFRNNFKVIDEGFHLCLHFLAVGQDDLWRLSFGRAGRHAFKRLFCNLPRLAQLFYPADITAPNIAIMADRYFEFEIFIAAVGHVAAEIEIDSAGAEGWAGQANGNRIFSADFRHAL